MYTLKIRWTRDENGVMVDEATYFISADKVSVHGLITSMDEMRAWPEDSFFDFHVAPAQDCPVNARLIRVEKDNKDVWYLCSNAWVLGPDGKTIERLI